MNDDKLIPLGSIITFRTDREFHRYRLCVIPGGNHVALIEDKRGIQGRYHWGSAIPLSGPFNNYVRLADLEDEIGDVSKLKIKEWDEDGESIQPQMGTT